MPERPTADRAIVAALKRIDAGLTVDFLDPPRRWAILHDLQVPGDLEATADIIARQLAADMREHGYVMEFHECQSAAWEKLKECRLVCYVANDDGSYRPLDARIVQKLERMDYNRRNLGLKDWQQLLRVKADALRASRQRTADDLWSSIERDPVFARCLSDILWGVRPTRSIDLGGVKGGDDAAGRERDSEGVSGAGGVPAAVHPGGGGVPVRPADVHAAAG